MATFKTQLSVLQTNVTKFPSVPALKIPQLDGGELHWKDISYSTFLSDIETSAKFWLSKLGQTSAQRGSVVGIWVQGTSYRDFVHTWGLVRAGFIPQLFSLRMTDPSVVYALLEKAEAVALVHDTSFASFLGNSPVPTFPAEEIPKAAELGGDVLLHSIHESSNGEDFFMIFHTSGSTSGMPKLVPITFKWLDALFYKMLHLEPFMDPSQKQQVTSLIGSFMHMGSYLCFWETLALGGCLVVPTRIPYPVDEASRMLDLCGITKLAIFPPLLSNVLHHAKNDPLLLESLQKLDVAMYAGLVLDAADEKWANSHGIRTVNMFGSTETGYGLCSPSTVEGPAYLEPFPNSIYEFIPLQNTSGSGKQLLEWVISPESPDCPHQSLRSSDGKFHTGDLFIEVEPGKYSPQGRADSWIKMETALRCDTSSIEANAMETCGHDLVHAVVVVGSGRPSPVMIIEPRDEIIPIVDGELSASHLEQVKRDIIQRITPFHQRRYKHERIEDARFILVARKGSLPRTATKGNIRKTEIEQVLKHELNKIYEGI